MGAKGRPEMPYGWGRVPYSFEDRTEWRNLPFPIEEYETRIATLQHHMDRLGRDVVVVVGDRSDTSYIRYLTNFEDFYGGQSILVVPRHGAPGFTTNAVMHGEPMHSGIQDCWVRDVRCAAAPRTVTGSAEAVTIFDHVEDFIDERTGGVETISLVGSGLPTLTDFLTTRYPDVQIENASSILDEMRKIKSPREVEVLRTAAHQADAGLIAAMGAVKPGAREFDIAAAANEALFKTGAEHSAFAIAVAAGERSGFKHVAPTGYVVKEGDIVYVDLGSRNMGYYSDCSRQTVCGTPSAEQLRFMEAQIAIVEEVMKKAGPGVVIGDLAEIGIAMAREAGYEQYLYFRGHGIGCATHDKPSIAPGNPVKLEPGMVFCFEPMLVKFRFGTACWEDMWHVTQAGVERLNEAPYRFW